MGGYDIKNINWIMYNQIKFLPVGPEDSERLKYTESFEINHD